MCSVGQRTESSNCFEGEVEGAGSGEGNANSGVMAAGKGQARTE